MQTPLPNAAATLTQGHEQIGKRLEELVQHIQKGLPLANLITRLEINHSARVVEFTWQSRHFVSTLGLEVFELKEKNLFITGASMLVRSALNSQDKNTRIVIAIADSVAKAEDLIKTRRIEAAFELLDSVKQSIQKQIGLS